MLENLNLLKVITGVHKADESEMILDGKKVNFRSTMYAQYAVIAAIYQHVTAYPARIVIMDEPAAALPKSEFEKLYSIAEKFKRGGQIVCPNHITI